MRECQDVNITGCQIVNARNRGILIRGSTLVRIADCTFQGRPDDKTFKGAVRVDGGSSRVMIANSFLGKGSEGDLVLPPDTGSSSGNISL